MTDVHPDWTPEDGPLEGDLQALSASSLSNVLSKPQLEDWRAKESAARIHGEWEMLSALRQTDPIAAQTWMRDAAYHQHRGRLNATDRGTVIHHVFESWFTGEQLDPAYVPEELFDHLRHLARWVEESGFTPAHQERVVWSEAGDGWGMGGRFDVCGTGTNLPPGLGLIDLKTSAEDLDGQGKKRRPYPVEVCLQLAPYFYATHMATHTPRTLSKGRNRIYLVSEQEKALAEPAPTFDWTAVLLITPQRTELYPVEMSEWHRDAARAALQVYRHQSSVKGYLGRSIMESRADNEKGS